MDNRNVFFSQIVLVLALVFYLNNASATTYTLSLNGSITNLNDWRDNSSNTPSDFTSGDTWYFDNTNTTITLNAAWGLDAAATVIIGDGTNAFTLVYSGSGAIGTTDANIVLSSNATLVLNRPYNFNNTKTTFNSGSTVIYSAGTSSVATDQYRNLSINANVASNTATVDVLGDLSISSGVEFMIDNNGILNVNGDVLNTGGTLSGDDTGTLTVSGSGITHLRFTTGNENFASVNILTSYFCSLYTPLNVSGNFTINGGNLWFQGGSLTLNGNVTFGTHQMRGSTTATIQIGGSGSITGSLIMEGSGWGALSELTLNRSGASLNIGSQLLLFNSLNPTSGTITTNNNVILYSYSGTKGRVGPISASGNLSGNITIYQYKPAGLTDWVNLCSSGVTGKSFSDWNTSFAITCPSGCPDGSSVGGQTFTSVYSYNESAGSGIVTASDPIHYVALPGTSTAIDSKTGYWVYLGNNYPNTSDLYIVLTGAVNTKTSSGAINISLTGSSGSENGWNLIANPYPSPIQASQVISAFGASIDPTSVQAYDPDLPGWVPFSSGDVIPMGQAFYVRALSNAAVLPDENWKTASANNTPIFKQIGQATASNGRAYFYDDFLIDLQSDVVPKKFFSQAYFTFESGGSSSYDLGKDAFFMDNPIEPNLPAIYSFSGPDKLRRNAQANISNGSLLIPIQVNTGYSGQYRLKPVNLHKLPSGACVILKDLQNSISHDLRSGPYTCSISAGATTPQFELQITMNAVPLASSQVNDPLCANDPDGSIKVLGGGNGPWNYVWKDQNNDIIRQVNNHAGPDTLKNLFPGNYSVEINNSGTCDQASAQFQLNALTAQPLAAFQANQNSSSIFAWEPLHFTNLSQNATSYSWDFGNGITAGTYHGSIAYAQPGNFTVKLSAINDCGEVSLAQSQVQITANPLSIDDSQYTLSSIFIAKENEELFLFNSSDAKNIRIELYNLLGQQLYTSQFTADKQEKIKVNFQPCGEMILIRISDGQSSRNQRLVY